MSSLHHREKYQSNEGTPQLVSRLNQSDDFFKDFKFLINSKKDKKVTKTKKVSKLEMELVETSRMRANVKSPLGGEKPLENINISVRREKATREKGAVFRKPDKDIKELRN